MFRQTAEEFREKQMSYRARLLKYIERGSFRRKAAVRQVLPTMPKRRGSSMYYNNSYTRIAVCEQATAIIEPHLKKQEGEVFMFGATCARFGVTLSSPKGQPIESIGKWIEELFAGMNYIGVIEAAWFGNFRSSGSPYPEPRLSWHFHILIWGQEEDRLRAIKHLINRTERGFTGFQNPADCRRARTDDGLADRLRYFLKAPVKESRIINNPVQFGTSRKPGRTKKRDLAPGNGLRLMSLIGDRMIGDLLPAGGEGVDLKMKVLDAAKAELERQEAQDRARQREFLRRAVNVGLRYQ